MSTLSRLGIWWFALTALMYSSWTWAINDPVDDVDRAFASGQFGKMAEMLEQQVGDLSKGKSDQLVRLCFAYSKIKKYKLLEACLAELEHKILAGDPSGGKFGSWWAKPTWFVTSRMPSSLMLGTKDWDITPYPSIMRAEAAIDQGNYAQAIDAALAAKGKLTSNQTQGNYFQVDVPGLLALAYAQIGDKFRAREYIQQLYQLDIKSFATSSAEIYVRTTLARALVAVGDYQAALEAIVKDNTSGLRAMASGFAGMKPDESLWEWEETPRNFMRHKCELEVGRIKEAKAGFDALLKKPTIHDHSGIYWLLLFDRSRIAEAESDQDSAIEFLKQSIEVIERQRSTINTEAGKIGFVGDKQAAYASLIRLLLLKGQAATAFEYVERSKARALVDMLAEKQDFSVASGNAEQVRALLAMAASAEASALVQDASTDKPQARNLVSRARQQLREQAPELASLVNVSSLSAAEIQAKLPQDEALVEYYYNAPNLLVAFVLTRSGIQVVRLDESSLLDDVRAFRAQIEAVGSAMPLDLARKLYDRIVAPVAATNDKKKLVIVAHGPLHYLPFNALHDGSRFVIEKFSLRQLPSASVLSYLKAQAAAKSGEILAFGNPDLGDPRFDLVHAQAEAVAITLGRPQSRVLLRKEASESALRQYGEGFRYLHFATHGEFNPEVPLKSALLLAKDATSDGLLTLDKLYSLRLDADLVTLSACETGLGKVASGDDVVGLTRGFLYAGSRSIVASLWKVDDLATSFLMTRFYDRLRQGDKREALREAQIETMRKYPHPFFWAAFQLTGNAN